MASGLRIEDGDFLQGPKFGALYEGVQGNAVISGYEVGQSGTGALTVGVSGGSAVIGGNLKTNASGVWYLTHDSADATYPRYDLIAGSKDGTPFIQKGTAGSIPSAPQGLNETIPLSVVYVGSNSTTLLGGDVSDNRTFRKNTPFYIEVNNTGSLTGAGSPFVGLGSIFISGGMTYNYMKGYNNFYVMASTSAPGGGSAWTQVLVNDNLVIGGSGHPVLYMSVASDSTQGDATNYSYNWRYEPSEAEKASGFYVKMEGMFVNNGMSFVRLEHLKAIIEFVRY